MFAAEIRVTSLRSRFSPWGQGTCRKTERNMDDKATNDDPRSRISQILAEMLPSTVEEIAAAVGLDAVTAAACLDDLAGRNRVMFNPLTKRFSLPRAWPGPGIAA